MALKTGVLALQGAFAEHEKMLTALGEPVLEVRKKEDLEKCHALILPGGESTVMGKLLKDLDILDSLKKMIQNGLPVFGTCAGEILLASRVDGLPSGYLATIPMDVKRNAYGRQLGSFSVRASFQGMEGTVPMDFIRAPYIASTGDGVEVLARVEDRVVAVKYGRQLAISFHPEISGDLRIHRYFLEKVAGIDT